jgi:hypothetical protein
MAFGDVAHGGQDQMGLSHIDQAGQAEVDLPGTAVFMPDRELDGGPVIHDWTGTGLDEPGQAAPVGVEQVFRHQHLNGHAHSLIGRVAKEAGRRFIPKHNAAGFGVSNDESVSGTRKDSANTQIGWLRFPAAHISYILPRTAESPSRTAKDSAGQLRPPIPEREASDPISFG